MNRTEMDFLLKIITVRAAVDGTTWATCLRRAYDNQTVSDACLEHVACAKLYQPS